MEYTLFSNRIQKSNLQQTDADSIRNALVTANKAKHYAYKLLLLKTRKGVEYEKSIHLLTKDKCGMNDYFVNSAVQSAQGILKSQKELQGKYISDTINQIKTRKMKVTNLRRIVTNKQKILDAIKRGQFIATISDREFTPNGKHFCVQYKKRTDIYYNLYDFEHMYLVPQIKDLRNRINLIQRSIDSLEKKLSDLKRGIFKGVCFGSARLFKKQFTVDEYTKDHTRWKEDFDKARYSSFQVSGRKDAKYGNFVFKYDYKNKKLDLIINETHTVAFENVHFPYGQEHINYAIENQKTLKKPITWTIEDHFDYYLFKVTVTVQERKDINFCKAYGVIGVDTNHDHLAWSETNSKGQLIDHGIIHYNLKEKATGQSIKIIEESICQLVAVATQKHKPIVREDLSFDDLKSKLKYEDKTHNKKISHFAYNRIIISLESRCKKEAVSVFVVNPAFTSQIGKMKYMKQKGISIHVSASHVIARRGMGFKETVPPALFRLLPEKIVARHHWTHWSFLSRLVEAIPTECFYKSSSTKICGSPDEYVKLLQRSSA